MKLFFFLVAVSIFFHFLALGLDKWASTDTDFAGVSAQLDFGLRSLHLTYDTEVQDPYSRTIDYDDLCDSLPSQYNIDDCHELRDGSNAAYAFLLASGITCTVAAFVSVVGHKLKFNHIFITVALLLTTFIINIVCVVVWYYVADGFIRKYFDRELKESFALAIVPMFLIFFGLIRSCQDIASPKNKYIRDDEEVEDLDAQYSRFAE